MQGGLQAAAVCRTGFPGPVTFPRVTAEEICDIFLLNQTKQQRHDVNQTRQPYSGVRVWVCFPSPGSVLRGWSLGSLWPRGTHSEQVEGGRARVRFRLSALATSQETCCNSVALGPEFPGGLSSCLRSGQGPTFPPALHTCWVHTGSGLL